jgi:prevent-host-death family protein
MRTIGIFEAKTKLAEICRQVMTLNEPVIITKRGTPLVRIDPIASQPKKSSIWNDAKIFHRNHPTDEDEFELPSRTAVPQRPSLEL